MAEASILVVDDNELFRDSIIETLRRKGHQMTGARSAIDGLEKFKAGDGYDLIISDMKMPGMSGLELLEQIRLFDKEVPFLIITAYGAIETAVEAMRKGAFDFIQKSDNLIEQLEMTVERTLEFRNLVRENRELKTVLSSRWQYIGGGNTMSKIRELVDTVAQSRSTVLVCGESGTGKELIARSIHYQSLRRDRPFIKINCAALPEGLIESELFGHEKGAFTGAIRGKRGKFELANGGTLLLDEIGEMDAGVQAKLLRVLQEREINKVGGDEPVKVDVRIVATTNRTLLREVENGRFRQDLYYRLNVFHIDLPPLRERREDIAQLCEHFIARYNDENGFAVEGIEPEALAALESYDWPGNIRELENSIERAVVLSRSGMLTADKFAVSSTKTRSSGEAFSFKPGLTISEAEKELILRTLEGCDDNRTRAAEMLGISIRTLRNKLHEYNDGDGEEPV